MKGVLHRIDLDLEEASGRSRWFVVSAIAVRAGLDSLLSKHARLDELYPEDEVF